MTTPASTPRTGERAFRIAAVPGVTLTKWTRVWAERFPDIPLEIVRTTEATQLWAVRDGVAEVAFVRSQTPDAEHGMIPLYDESPVVVVPAGHPLSEAGTVAIADLATENQLGGDAADAVELVAANVGVVLLPHSIARLHARKDVVAVGVSDAPPTPIALAWTAGSTDARIEEFIGIVRGRTARSSRSTGAVGTPETAAKPDKKERARTSGKGRPTAATPRAKKPSAAADRAAANRRKRAGR